MLERHRNSNGTYDGVGIMADLSGLSRQSMVDLAAEVKVNVDRLSACPYHEFAPILPLAALRQRYRCIECGGEVDRNAYVWHERGRRAPPAPAVPL